MPSADISDTSPVQNEKADPLLQLILDQPFLNNIIKNESAIQITHADDINRQNIFEHLPKVEINTLNPEENINSINFLSNGWACIILYNVLQSLSESRLFLSTCFDKLSVGGMLVITVPHQFLYERKLRLPSRRTPSHRKFFTPAILLADIEEAIDSARARIRYMSDCDTDYDYTADINQTPEGGQNMLLVLEKLNIPPWRNGLDADEIWAEPPTTPSHAVAIDRDTTPLVLTTFVPNRGDIRTIVIVKLDHRGDFLMAKESFFTLRQAFPAAQLALVCGSWNVPEAKTLGLFDEVIPFDFFPEDDSARLEMLPRDTLISDFAERMSGQTFDLAIDLRLYGDTRPVLQALKARYRAGFDRFDDFPWLDVRLNSASATEDDRAEVGFFPALSFRTGMCQHLYHEIRLSTPLKTKGHAVIWGPYKSLKAGHYKMTCLIEPAAEDFEIPFDVVVNQGNDLIVPGVLRVTAQQSPTFFFTLDRYCDDIEFRLLVPSSNILSPFRFFGLKWERSAALRGQHQSEMMSLLAHLIRMRLRDPYVQETL